MFVSVQDRCLVYAKRTIDTKIILDAPNGTPGDMAEVKARFGLFQDSATLDTT
jgi:hypothetical protein